MRKIFNCLFVLATMSLMLSACSSDDTQDDPDTPPVETPQDVVSMTDAKKSIATDVMSLPYHELTFVSKSNTEKPCLALYLHGGSSRGNDNQTQMGEAGIDSISNYLKAH